MIKKKIKTIVCGSTFGQFYLEALKGEQDKFEIIGLLAKGSDRSKQCAGHYKIPLYTNTSQLPGQVDLACVVLRSGVLGGKGTDLSLEFINKGIHVIQEHPVHHNDIAKCLKASNQKKVNFITGNLYINLPPVKRFIECARVLFKEQNATFIDISLATQVSFPLMHILIETLPNTRPLKINNIIKDNGPFQVITGEIGKIPITIKAHNQVNPQDPDNYLQLLHSINIGFPGGTLALTDTHGPVVWRPRLHIPKDKILGQLSVINAQHLSDNSSVILGPASPPSYLNILSKQWTFAIAKDLKLMKELINKETKIEKRAQQELLCSRQWQELTNALGYPELNPDAAFQPVNTEILHAQINKIPIEQGEQSQKEKPADWNNVFECTSVAEKEIENIKKTHISDYIQQMDKAAMFSMLKALQYQGTLTSIGKEYTEQEILEGSKASKKHHNVISRWLKVMAEKAFLKKGNKGYITETIIKQDSFNNQWEKVKEAWDFKLGNILSLQYFKNNADHLPDLMTDREKAAMLLFPCGQMDIANALYKETITARYLNKSVAQAVMCIAHEKYSQTKNGEKKSLNIIEIGAGTGATTEIVLPELRKNWVEKLNIQYLFSDVSSFFIGSAQKQFKNYPWLNFKIIDIDKNFQNQGLSTKSADIMIAAGVLNNAYDTNKVIQQFNNTLKPGGYMLITEPVYESIEILISQAFMMTAPVDGRTDTYSTFMSKQQWINIFLNNKAEKAVALPDDNHKLAPLGQRLFIVKKRKHA